MTKKNNDNDQHPSQEEFTPVVFTVQHDEKVSWVLVACPSEKIDILEASYALMLHTDSEVDLESALKSIGAEVRDYGDVEYIFDNGMLVDYKIPDHIKKIATHIIGKGKDDPELPTHPEEYMPGNDNSP